MFSPRLSWMFRTYGATDVRILNGWFKKWKSEGRPTASGKSPHADIDGYDYKYDHNLHESLKTCLEKSYDKVHKTGNYKDYQLIDPRPKSAFGKGTVIGFDNIPSNKFLSPDQSQYLSKDEIRTVLKEYGYDPDKPFVFTCGRGIMACIGEVASLIGGAKKTSMYDGGFQEYSAHEAPDFTDPNWESKYKF